MGVADIPHRGRFCGEGSWALPGCGAVTGVDPNTARGGGHDDLKHTAAGDVFWRGADSPLLGFGAHYRIFGGGVGVGDVDAADYYFGEGLSGENPQAGQAGLGLFGGEPNGRMTAGAALPRTAASPVQLSGQGFAPAGFGLSGSAYGVVQLSWRQDLSGSTQKSIPGAILHSRLAVGDKAKQKRVTFLK